MRNSYYLPENIFQTSWKLFENILYCERYHLQWRPQTASTTRNNLCHHLPSSSSSTAVIFFRKLKPSRSISKCVCEWVTPPSPTLSKGKREVTLLLLRVTINNNSSIASTHECPIDYDGCHFREDSWLFQGTIINQPQRHGEARPYTLFYPWWKETPSWVGQSNCTQGGRSQEVLLKPMKVVMVQQYDNRSRTRNAGFE